MDQQHFDDLSRGVARATSRRGVLKTLAGAAIGALFGLGQRGEAAAVAPNPIPLGRGKTLCNGTPTDTNVDAQNCGSCGHACTAGQACVQTCPTGQTNCNGACLDLNHDNNHCGACGNACPHGTACTGGACVVNCGRSQTNCNGVCVDLNTDVAHCGECGTACSAGQVCVNAACAANCPPGQTLCHGACRPLNTDNNNCGACGNTCAPNAACVNGVCTPVCPRGQTKCGGVCVGLDYDASNCGVCGHACPAGAICSGGACVCQSDNACPAGATCSGGVCVCPSGTVLCSGTCVNTSLDVNNCGACGNACPSANGVATCSSGVCGITCNAGLTNCNGVCLNLNSDSSNCGQCGHSCPSVANGSAVCSNGQCGVACNQGFTNCNGACVNLSTSSANCGACGHSCPATQGPNVTAVACSNSTCVITACAAGFANCDLAYANGCETNIATDASNCGGCGTTCPQEPHANAICQNQTCALTCQGENYDVDTNPANGCEKADLTTGNHTQGAAISLGNHDCFDTTVGTFSGTILSDRRVHANPAIVGFDSVSGSAPDWYSVFATGGFTCQDNLNIRITTSGGSAVGACYKLTVITNLITLSTTISGNDSVGQTITSGSGSYSDNSTIYFKVEKLCSTTTIEAVNYTVTFNL